MMEREDLQFLLFFKEFRIQKSLMNVKINLVVIILQMLSGIVCKNDLVLKFKLFKYWVFFFLILMLYNVLVFILKDKNKVSIVLY